jgi:hypothetical protein
LIAFSITGAIGAGLIFVAVADPNYMGWAYAIGGGVCLSFSIPFVTVGAIQQHKYNKWKRKHYAR